MGSTVLDREALADEVPDVIGAGRPDAYLPVDGRDLGTAVTRPEEQVVQSEVAVAEGCRS